MDNTREHSRWWHFLQTRMGRRQLAVLMSVALLPLIIVGWVSLGTSERLLEDQIHFALRACARAAEGQLREFIFRMKRATLASGADAIKLLEQVEHENLPATFRHSLSGICTSHLEATPDVEEFFILSPDGIVIASSLPTHLGKNCGESQFYEVGKSQFCYGDIVRDNDETENWIMSAPVRDPDSNELLGVIGCRISLKSLNDLTTGRRAIHLGARGQTLRIGETGETYLVNREQRIITETRSGSNTPSHVKAETYPVTMALMYDKEVTAEYLDYRGIVVTGASVIIPELGWTLITEVDFTQALAPLRRLRSGLVGIALSMGIFVSIVACNWTGKIMRPLTMLAQGDRALAKGNEKEALVPEEQLPSNELGDFVRTRNRRVKELFAKQSELIMEQRRRSKAASELDHISYGIVHDMRAPLRAIIGFGRILRDESGQRLDPEHSDYLNRMIIAASRMDRLITDMMSYSRLVREEVTLSAIDPGRLIREMMKTYPTLEGLKGHIQIVQDLPPVRGNDAALSQCFARILENAIQFSKPGQVAEVRIESEHREGRTRIWIRDNGVGIPEHMQKKIFGIFQQGVASPQTTGIGLAMARAAVERMGGAVGVESEVGIGSSFWIELDTATAVDEPEIVKNYLLGK